MSDIYTKKFKDKKGKIWKYIPSEEMKERFPEGYKIIGEISTTKNPKTGQSITISDGEEGTIVVQKNNFYKGKYRIIGYIPTEYEEAFIAVKKKNFNAIPLMILLTVVLLGIGGWMLWNKEEGPDVDPSIKDFVSSLKRPDDVDSTQIVVPGFGLWKMQADTNVLEVPLYNPEGNPCYFQYKIYETKTNTLLCETKLIPPGKGVLEVKLNKTIKEGKYDLSIKIDTYDLNDHTVAFNGATMNAKLEAIK